MFDYEYMTKILGVVKLKENYNLKKVEYQASEVFGNYYYFYIEDINGNEYKLEKWADEINHDAEVYGSLIVLSALADKINGEIEDVEYDVNKVIENYYKKGLSIKEINERLTRRK